MGELQWRHRFAGAVHASAFFALLGYAIHRSDNELGVYAEKYWINADKWSYVEPRRWLYRCFYYHPGADPSTGVFLNRTNCYDIHKRHFVEDVPNKLPVNILALALFYVAWSSVLHFWASVAPQRTRVLRWVDYVVTAPSMYIALGLSFGADSALALVLMPIALAALIAVACYVEQEATFPAGATALPGHTALVRWTGSSPLFTPFQAMERRRQAWIVFILLAYIPVIAPVCIMSKRLTEVQPDLDSQTGVGSAPSYVFYLTLVTVLIFTLFAVVFSVNLFVRFDREKWYIFLSLVSKLTLHLILGVTVFEQSGYVAVGEAGSETIDSNTLTRALVGCLIVVAVLAVPTFSLGYVYNRYHPKEVRGAALWRFQLLE
tara:strand:+ start:4662 stop:5789 length:1128 start_codon:yes stop_codon:yes gene_type:complete